MATKMTFETMAKDEVAQAGQGCIQIGDSLKPPNPKLDEAPNSTFFFPTQTNSLLRPWEAQPSELPSLQQIWLRVNLFADSWLRVGWRGKKSSLEAHLSPVICPAHPAFTLSPARKVKAALSMRTA